MPDISLCLNNKCPSRKSCYRYTAIPNEYRQSYSEFKVKEGEKMCNNYILNNKVKYKGGV